MPTTLEEKDWRLLLERIKKGKCTPFLGAGACVGALPLGGEIAKQWSRDYQYPMKDCDDLARVAQFVAVHFEDPMYPKEKILEHLKNAKPPEYKPPDFTDPVEPHRVLADLPLPVYMTTNYDDFMMQALEKRHKNPRRELCYWNRYVKKLQDQQSVFESEPGFEPTVSSPLVFHLHGHDEVAESLVLTEDDYLDFLVNISRDRNLLHHRIQRALTGASLLFIGYRLADWDFRVLFRGLVSSMEGGLRRISVAVQLAPDDQEEQAYLTDYFESMMKVKVYWGTAREFAADLRRRCEEEGIIQ